MFLTLLPAVPVLFLAKPQVGHNVRKQKVFLCFCTICKEAGPVTPVMCLLTLTAFLNC